MSESIAALFKTLTQGVYLIGVAHGEERNAFTAAWVMQVSFDPVLLALSINPLHFILSPAERGGRLQRQRAEAGAAGLGGALRRSGPRGCLV
jgi:flavin reductase (DIM6/NTAB) family NADH-FMN oxidoreductase RutF